MRDMKLITKVIQLCIAFLLMIFFINIFTKIDALNGTLNNYESYSIIKADEDVITEFNDFLNNHDVDYQINYEESIDTLNEELPYYSFLEKLVARKHPITINVEHHQSSLESVETYYNGLNYKDQKAFDASLKNAFIEQEQIEGDHNE